MSEASSLAIQIPASNCPCGFEPAIWNDHIRRHDYQQGRLPTIASPVDYWIPQQEITRKITIRIGRVPSPVDLVKKDSAWNNTETMKSIFSSLRGVFRHIEHKQTILIMDAAKCHISPKVLESAASLRIWVCIVPTDTTWLLQPLDISVFGHCKRLLRNRCRDRLIEQGHTADRDWFT